MNLQDNQNIHGVINGVDIGQHERVDELNQRIASRYFSDAPLEPNFAPRPVQTKQTIFPMVKISLIDSDICMLHFSFYFQVFILCNHLQAFSRTVCIILSFG